MKLPGAEFAVIPPAKVRDYLLSAEHSVGRFKATFFARVGYSRQDWAAFAQALRTIANGNDALEGGADAFGRRFEVRGTLVGPSGRRAEIVTIWIVRTGEATPRFVTAHPG